MQLLTQRSAGHAAFLCAAGGSPGETPHSAFAEGRCCCSKTKQHFENRGRQGAGPEAPLDRRGASGTPLRMASIRIPSSQLISSLPAAVTLLTALFTSLDSEAMVVRKSCW